VGWDIINNLKIEVAILMNYIFFHII